MSDREMLRAMAPNFRSDRQRWIRLAKVFDCNPNTIQMWAARNIMPKHARMIVRLYLGEINMANIENIIEGET